MGKLLRPDGKPIEPESNCRSTVWATPMPHGGGMNGDCASTFAVSMVRFFARGQPMTFVPLHGGDQSSARAKLAGIFMHECKDREGKPMQDLLCVDADIGFPPEWADEHLARIKCDIAVGIYKSRTQPGHPWTVDCFPPDESGKPNPKSVVVEREGLRTMLVKGCGFGAVRLRRHALEVMIHHYRQMREAHPDPSNYEQLGRLWPPDLEFNSGRSLDGGETQYSCFDFWRPLTDENGERRYDDFAFFLRARDAGLDITCLVDWPIVHDGMAGNFVEEQGKPLDETALDEALRETGS